MEICRGSKRRVQHDVCVGLRPLQNPHLRRISALCAARSLAYLYDMSSFAALLRLELHPHLGVLQRSRVYWH
ncbi:lipoprotein signal peptidase [Neisseria shayeganii]|uniref:lipoprotein signal peptidase n=1 Tax=Neisseria shayeganii TaxID=607712 RepID=UPI001E2861D9|nr:lipoprotein signal peptidase [Neisseria shayeganii]